MRTSGLPYESHRRGEQIVAVDTLAAGDGGHHVHAVAGLCRWSGMVKPKSLTETTPTEPAQKMNGRNILVERWYAG